MSDSAREREIRELAIQIADESAACDIRDLGHSTETDREWRNIHTGDEDEDKYLARSARYLELRGLLERQPDQPHLVRSLVPE
jgi:hypothetical protein